MKHFFFMIFLSALVVEVQAKTPSRAAIVSCLSAQSTSKSVKWVPLPTEKIYSEDDYLEGFNAIYYIKSGNKPIGYAERGHVKAVIYGNQLFPIAQAHALAGFHTRPTELDPFSADWATVADQSGTHVCISFPYGDLGQSGSFQKNRSAYLIAIGKINGPRILHSATGNLDALQMNQGEQK